VIISKKTTTNHCGGGGRRGVGGSLRETKDQAKIAKPKKGQDVGSAQRAVSLKRRRRWSTRGEKCQVSYLSHVLFQIVSLGSVSFQA